MSEQGRKAYDVIIAGAGPVGLFVATELALAKCSVLVLERAEHPESPLKQVPFGIPGLSAPTIEALSRRGLLDELQVPKRLKNPHTAHGAPGRRQAGHFAGIAFHDGELDTARWTHRLPGAPPASLMAEMQELEAVLARRAQTLGVVVKRGCAISGFEQGSDGITVRSGDDAFDGKWLVGCDGSRSVVRRVGGFEFAGTEPEFTGYTIKADIADPEKLRPGRNPTSRGFYMQSQPGYLVVQEFDGGAAHNTVALTLDHVQEVLRRVSQTDVTLSALHVATTWTDRARQATTYRNNRVFLAGDAAHIHAPLGGQGLNLGIGDAMNLGWKLASVVRYDAPLDLLDTYQTERHLIGARVLDWSRAQALVMRPDPAARAMRAIMQDLLDTRDGATYVAGRVWGVHTHYDLGDGHPLLGRSLPNFELEDGTKIGQWMGDALWMLLDFEATSALSDLARAYAGRIKYISSRAQEQVGFKAALVRPDGYIAWACETASTERDLTTVRAVLAKAF